MTSLLPGTLPCGQSGEGDLLVHCLDVGLPMKEQLSKEEGLFRRAFDNAERQAQQ